MTLRAATSAIYSFIFLGHQGIIRISAHFLLGLRDGFLELFGICVLL